MSDKQNLLLYTNWITWFFAEDILDCHPDTLQPWLIEMHLAAYSLDLIRAIVKCSFEYTLELLIRVRVRCVPQLGHEFD
jgi:hypothetical protein